MTDGPLVDELRQDATGLLEADGPAIPLAADDTLDGYTRSELRKIERQIALPFHGGRMWIYAAATLASFAVWAAFFPLAIMGLLGPVGLGLGFLFATFCASFGFISVHDAMHSNIYPPNHRLHWLNELSGHLASIPIALGFNVARLAHMEHHKHTNDPARDPDITDDAPNWWMAIYKTWWNRQPGVDGAANRYRRMVYEMNTPVSRRAALEAALMQIFYHAVLFAMAWNGFAIEAALLWWLPRQIGVTWVRFWPSWAPHHPQRQGRYKCARIFKARIGYWLSLGMEYHLIHHLYPGIPNHRQREAYFALKDVLRRQGVDVSAH